MRIGSLSACRKIPRIQDKKEEENQGLYTTQDLEQFCGSDRMPQSLKPAVLHSTFCSLASSADAKQLRHFARKPHHSTPKHYVSIPGPHAVIAAPCAGSPRTALLLRCSHTMLHFGAIQTQGQAGRLNCCPTACLWTAPPPQHQHLRHLPLSKVDFCLLCWVYGVLRIFKGEKCSVV